MRMKCCMLLVGEKEGYGDQVAAASNKLCCKSREE